MVSNLDGCSVYRAAIKIRHHVCLHSANMNFSLILNLNSNCHSCNRFGLIQKDYLFYNVTVSEYVKVDNVCDISMKSTL